MGEILVLIAALTQKSPNFSEYFKEFKPEVCIKLNQFQDCKSIEKEYIKFVTERLN